MTHPHIQAADPHAFRLDDAFEAPYLDEEFDEELDRQLAAYREALADFRSF